MQCVNCGVEVEVSGAFCPSCGKLTNPSPAVPPANNAQVSAAPGAGVERNVAGFLCYLLGFVTGIFFLVADPYRRDRFIRFHAFQSIFLSVAWFAAYWMLAVLVMVLPGVLWRVGWLLHSAVGLGFFVLWVFLMYKAYNHEEFKVPFLGDLAAKQA